MGLLENINAILITAQDCGPDALAAGKEVWACVASMGLNSQLNAQAASSLSQLATDMNKANADILADGGPAKAGAFLVECAKLLNYVSANGPGTFQAFENLYAVFTTQGTSSGINALGSGGLSSFITAINGLIAIEKQATATQPAAGSPAQPEAKS